ncbi:MAG: phosphatase PAP2/dual specificity phosphatase family protein [Planctomycetes bacterium]|nr:phosphatase PAP2/dual specificity phosphatase family protein [Planctomycetota bacterium]
MGDLHGIAGETALTMTRKAVASAGLSLFFLLVYGGANWITTLRPDVGTWYFDWELEIPLVPVMIVPYMSIDLFFVLAPFLCSSRRELATLARRIVFSILVAGTFFLIMPLTLGFRREPVPGIFGPIFEWFRGMDAPHNLFPSLHIALRTLLAEIYARHTRGLLRVIILAWFSLIGFSTVLTHQHHLVDIAGGFLLAGFAFYFCRESSVWLPVVPNIRVGILYGMGAVLVLTAAPLVWPLGAFFLWPATVLAIVAAAYFGLGPGIFRKSAGRLPWSTRFVFAPLLFGQHLSLLYYRRQCRAWDEVTHNVLVGRRLNDSEAADLVRRGVTAVLDLTAEFSEATPFLALRYRNLAILDLTAPTTAQQQEAALFIAEECVNGKVYVHCKVGYSRSAAVVGAYLLASGQAAGAEEAVAMLRRARPAIIVRREALAALRKGET